MSTVYRRREMELAAWQTLSRRAHEPGSAEPPRVFLNRIKRLLDLDTDREEPIFPVAAPGGKGKPAGYDAFGVFLMVFGLCLIDAGVTQGDVVFVLRHMKPKIRQAYDHILKHPPALRMNVLARDMPNAPTRLGKPESADLAVYFSIRKIELRECWEMPSDDVPDPFFIQPIFSYGATALAMEMERRSCEDPTRLVVEIAELVVLVRRILATNEVVDFVRGAGQKSKTATP